MARLSPASLFTAVITAALSVRAGQSSGSFSLSNLPNTWQAGQTGTNQCGQWGASSQDSMCQNAFINSAVDFCLWGPPSPSSVSDDEPVMVSWCTRAGYGTRLIPDGTLSSVHFIKTAGYVQVTGTGDFTKMNVVANDEGGELDPHGENGNGNPVGGLVFTNAFGSYQQTHEWTNFMSATEYCFKACIKGPNAALQCNHVYDVQGCEWNMPANYGSGFEQCEGDEAQLPGIYIDGGSSTSTFTQATNADDDGYVNTAPPPHPAPASSNCAPQASPSGAALGAVSSPYGNATSSATLTRSSLSSSRMMSSTSSSSSSSKTASSGPAQASQSHTGAAVHVIGSGPSDALRMAAAAVAAVGVALVAVPLV